MTPEPSPAENSPGPDSGGLGERPRPSSRGAGVRRESPIDLPKVEGFLIEGVLGSGATGTVFSGVQLAVDRPVAIKFLHPDLCSDKRAIVRLQREARAAARLGHPGIISAVDMGVSQGRWWYAMELVEGISLAERIQEKGTLTEREAIRLFVPIVDALEHAHGMGVIHRDVKPANILIDGRGRARLVDLGLAWAETDPRVTSGGTLGTPHYISPEQARSPSDVDGRSDIWSLGATLFHALTGRPPFVGESVAEVLSAVLHQPLPDPRTIMPGLSKGMRLVLRKCLSQDPNLRYRTPLDLLKDLERMRERRAPKVRADELEPLTDDPGRALRLAGIVALVLVAIGGWVAWWQPWSGPVDQGTRSMDVSEWPALDEVRRGLESNTISLRRSEESLTLLASPSLGGGPPSGLLGDLALLRLEWDRRLDAALDALLTEGSVHMSRVLSGGDLAEAALYLEQELPRRMIKATGYSSIEECPQSFSGKQHALLMWQGLVDQVTTARAAGIARVVKDLERYRLEVLHPRVQGLVAAARYRDALDVLGDPSMDWLSKTRAAAMRLDGGDLERALQSDALHSALYRDRDDVRNRWLLVDGELVAFLIKEAGKNEGQMYGGEAFGLAWSQELERRGVIAEQLPHDSEWRSAKTYESMHRGLVEQETNLQREQTQDFFRKESNRSLGFASQREFGAARDTWAGVLEQPGSLSDMEVAHLRMREMDLLASSMELVARVVRGQGEMTLEVKGIPRSGICTETEDPLMRPFRLLDRVTGVTHLFALTGSVKAQALPSSQRVVLVSGGDLERLLLDGLSLPPDDGTKRVLDASEAPLALALLRFHVGDPALAPLPSPGQTMGGPDAALWADLEHRVAAIRSSRERLAADQQGRMDKALMRLREQFAGGATSLTALQVSYGDFLQRYDDLISTELRQELEELFGSLTRAPARVIPEDLFPGAQIVRDRRGALQRVRFDFVEGSSQGWLPGLWSTDGDGLVLRAGTPGDHAFLRETNAARLDLAPAFNVDERIVVRFHLEPLGVGEPDNELCLTVAGMHVFFVDRKSDPFMAYVAGTLEKALTSLRRGKLRSLAKFEGFPSTQPTTVEISLQPRTMVLEEVRVGGRRLSLGGVRRSSGREGRGLLAVRSRVPIRVLWIEVEARERDE